MNREEIYKYLRLPKDAAVPNVDALIDECAFEAEKLFPKSVWGVFSCEVNADSVSIGGAKFKSTRLAKHINGCKSAAVFALTLGVGSDMLLRRCTAEGAAKAAVMQAVLAELTEEHCDALEQEILANLKTEGMSRFSPGFYDLALTSQREVFNLLNVTQKTGIVLTDSCMMIPSKSVTAIIGLKEQK